MFTIKIYNYDQNYIYLNDMISNNESIFELSFESPKSEEQFCEITNQLDYEGYLYELAKDNVLYASGVYTIDSLADDLGIEQ